MIIVKISGGLGNQLFQYAFGRQVAERNGAELKLDLRKLGPKRHPGQRRPWHYALWPFCIRATEATQAECRALKFDVSTTYGRLHAAFLHRLFRTKDMRHPSPHYVKQRQAGLFPELLEVSDPAYLDGHWETARYFPDVEAALREELRFRDPAEGRNAEFLQEIRGSNSASLHVRRGDIVSDSEKYLCREDYFRQAADLIREKAGDVRFFVFSDDIPWCRANIDVSAPLTFVDVNGRTTAHEDLRLMSECRHHIVPNSTLSWWGAWLNPSPTKIVVCPRNWRLPQIIPDEWIAI